MQHSSLEGDNAPIFCVFLFPDVLGVIIARSSHEGFSAVVRRAVVSLFRVWMSCGLYGKHIRINLFPMRSEQRRLNFPVFPPGLRRKIIFRLFIYISIWNTAYLYTCQYSEY